jgi:hypothetical protein
MANLCAEHQVPCRRFFDGHHFGELLSLGQTPFSWAAAIFATRSKEEEGS